MNRALEENRRPLIISISEGSDLPVIRVELRFCFNLEPAQPV